MALKQPAKQIRNFIYPEKAVDGDKSTCTSTGDVIMPWWRVDFSSLAEIVSVNIQNGICFIVLYFNTIYCLVFLYDIRPNYSTSYI